MTYTIRPSAEVQFTKAPTIAIAGPTGSGKTESAMRLARGYVGAGGRFVVIDTEEKRALYKKGRYTFDWLDLQPPFTPESYRGALAATKGYDAVVVDSGSHEYAGEGGMQDMQAEDLERMSKGDTARMERLTAPAWKRAKLEHKKLMGQVIRYPTLLIVCLRAEPKIKFTKDEHGKTQIVDAGYQPICEKMFMYEMLVGAMVHADNPGVPLHLKKLEPDLEPVFVAGKQIDEATGERLAAWASTRSAAPHPKAAPSSSGTASPAEAADCISIDQATSLEDALREGGKSKDRLLANVSRQYGQKLERLSQIRSADYAEAMAYARGA
jgi:energy-coupling factor transporter ATP-binding protein EcfA2